MNLKDAEARLKKEQADLEKELKGLEKVPDMGSDVEGETYEEEADEAEEFSTNLGIREALKERLEKIKEALAKIKSGKYGVCENCGDQIPDKILNANPEAEYCEHCKGR